MSKFCFSILFFFVEFTVGYSQERVIAIRYNQLESSSNNITQLMIANFQSGEVRLIPSNTVTRYAITKDSVFTFAKEMKTLTFELLERKAWDSVGSMTKVELPHLAGYFSIEFEKVKADGVWLSYMHDTQINNYLKFDSCSIEYTYVQSGYSFNSNASSLKTLEFGFCDSLAVYADKTNGRIGRVDINSSSLRAGLFDSDSLYLRDFTFGKRFKLSNHQRYDRRKVIGLVKVDVNKLPFDCQFFKLSPLYNTYHESITLFNTIKDTQKSHHYEKGYELADKDLLQYQYLSDSGKFSKTEKIFGQVKNWMAYNWWDYGYDKGKVVPNSFIVMLFFFFINLLFFDKLLKTYPIKSLVEAETINQTHYVRHKYTRSVKSFFYCLFFTGTIFWGIKFDFGNVSLQRIGLVLLIIVEYTTGIVCLAYIANYIIVR